MTNNSAGALEIPAGNYLQFSNLSDETFVLTAQVSVSSDSTNRASLNAIQIIQIPEPSAPSATHLRGRILLLAKFPGYSSRSLLDPGLQAPIPCRDQEWIVPHSNP